MKEFGFIGCGNMGGSLARAASRGRGVSAVLLADHFPAKAQELAAELQGSAATVLAVDNWAAASQAKYLFLGVKPHMMAGMLESIRPTLKQRAAVGDRFVLVSMAAGLSIARIREMAGEDFPVIRIMPNTPCAIGQGMLLCAAEGVTEEEKAAFCEGMCAAGRLDWLEESLIDAGSAVSGCGPAFVYLFIEALADGGVECGLPRAKAMEYAAQTLLGAAGLVLESGKHPGELKDAVCSPGGSTIVGVHALESSGFRAAAMDAVTAAFRKTKDLGKN
ncbi:MAG: pyrroline-5-carboxylate reductase [Oscillospiraceae bacterium]|nr:pyrroline-5-carboxylate reductase [Oscillospiraceae bacterium]